MIPVHPIWVDLNYEFGQQNFFAIGRHTPILPPAADFDRGDDRGTFLPAPSSSPRMSQGRHRNHGGRDWDLKGGNRRSAGPYRTLEELVESLELIPMARELGDRPQPALRDHDPTDGGRQGPDVPLDVRGEDGQAQKPGQLAGVDPGLPGRDGSREAGVGG